MMAKPDTTTKSARRLLSRTALRKKLKATASAKLVGKGRFVGFRRRAIGVKKLGGSLRGLTKCIHAHLESGGILPAIAKKSTTRRGGSWKGRSGGRRRGKAVDSQLSSIANGRTPKRSLYKLTDIALKALDVQSLKLVCGQLAVSSPNRAVGSAIDLVACREDELVIIELKCGHDTGRTAPARFRGKEQHMRGPLKTAKDCVQNRHLAQLAASVEMFKSNQHAMKAVASAGIKKITAKLMYVRDTNVELLDLPQWWIKRGSAILSSFK